MGQEFFVPARTLIAVKLLNVQEDGWAPAARWAAELGFVV